MKEEVQKDYGAEKLEKQNVIPDSPYSKLKRELSEEDLKSPAVQRLLLAEIDKLEFKVSDYGVLRNNFHKIDKECSVLKEKAKSSKSSEILYGFSLTIGSIIIGLSSLVWDDGYGWINLTIGGLLIIGGLISKFIKWN